ncbi:sigma-54 interaction domain-containing protein [Burkholderia pyrrocinia]|uniref:sigma-54 interaction domain-containing protein n=1 Tax=Burkholderia pyrrocinia TaxID=60550 RepID=UPI00158CEB49|nr:sigma-54 dependent transcriptional regulator [Burkholderia pyrrocinia]
MSTTGSIQATSLGLHGSSPAMTDLRRYLAKVAQTDTTVLVTGETGTGKERVAAAVHRLSARTGKPFIAVNCAAVPDSLFESEMFGHERGAFTSAQNAFPGRFVEADGGTLFLDEISEMPPAVQAKLLRLLEDRTVMPVGSLRRRAVDVRIVAASNERLEDLVAERRFRPDLFYRLNVARIEIPPLRERPEDIASIVDHFVAEHNQRRAMRVGQPDPALLECMRHYRWPGNVRELRNLVEALFIDAPEGRPFGLGDLPPAFRRLFVQDFSAGEHERERLVSVLRQTNWNKMEAARQMNWSRMTLYRKLAKYNLDGGNTASV